MYTIEKVIRRFEGENGEVEKEIKFLAGVGNLTADVEAKEVEKKDGEKIVVAGDGYKQCIAFNYWEDGERKTLFFPVEAWGKTAENLGKLGTKGRQLCVVGRLEERAYTNQAGKTYINEIFVIEKFQVTSKGWGQEENEENKENDPVNVDGFQTVDDEEIPF